MEPAMDLLAMLGAAFMTGAGVYAIVSIVVGAAVDYFEG
jgi:hypothetical protein